MPLQKFGHNRGLVPNVAIQPPPPAVGVPVPEDEGALGPRDPNNSDDDGNGGAEERENEVPEEGSGMAVCCLPGGCGRPGDVIFLADPGDAVKMICNNESCTAGEWMHAGCFKEWEKQVLTYLRSCGRARSWSEKQRLQNLWTKKGYDLAFKACDCNCTKGHLRKDLGYIPPPSKNAEAEKRQKKTRKMKAIQRRGSTGTANLPMSAENPRTPLRIRTSSLCSTGSSPPSSEGISPQIPVAKAQATTKSGGKFDFFQDPEQAAAGNIFWRRSDLSSFRRLPIFIQNPYQIKIEDEGPHGNDETRSFILTSLSMQKVTVVCCVICQASLPVYDKYPLIDGTFFLSPIKYLSSSIHVQHASVVDHHRPLYLNSICMQCLNGLGTALTCVGCRSQWSGSTLIIGSMYSYDIFAARPCCPWRFTCKACSSQILEPGSSYLFFSQYTRLVCCPRCGNEDFHFVKPIRESFRQFPVQQ